MGLLGNFLESFYGGRHSFETVYARAHREHSEVARSPGSRRPPIGRPKVTSPDPAVITVEYEFWGSLPDQVRVDKTTTKNGVPSSTVEIAAGGCSFKRDKDGNVETGELPKSRRLARHAMPIDYCRHFDNGLIRDFFTSLVLEELGETTIAGRSCVRFKALPVSEDGLWPHWLPSEADAFEFAADLEYPSLLGIKSFLSEVEIDSINVIEVVFNESIESEQFEIQPGEGKSARKAIPITQPISLSEAIARMPFQVLLPLDQRDTTSFDLHYQPERPGRPDELTISCGPVGGKRLWYSLSSKQDQDSENELEWQIVNHDGQMYKLSDPETEGGMIVVSFERSGTWVTLFSDSGPDELLNFAASLQPPTK